ncbi:hypothetical protein QOT17_012789 [Balamuthia mandrillaris]
MQAAMQTQTYEPIWTVSENALVYNGRSKHFKWERLERGFCIGGGRAYLSCDGRTAVGTVLHVLKEGPIEPANTPCPSRTASTWTEQRKRWRKKQGGKDDEEEEFIEEEKYSKVVWVDGLTFLINSIHLDVLFRLEVAVPLTFILEHVFLKQNFTVGLPPESPTLSTTEISNKERNGNNAAVLDWMSKWVGFKGTGTTIVPSLFNNRIRSVSEKERMKRMKNEVRNEKEYHDEESYEAEGEDVLTERERMLALRYMDPPKRVLEYSPFAPSVVQELTRTLMGNVSVEYEFHQHWKHGLSTMVCYEDVLLFSLSSMEPSRRKIDATYGFLLENNYWSALRDKVYHHCNVSAGAAQDKGTHAVFLQPAGVKEFYNQQELLELTQGYFPKVSTSTSKLTDPLCQQVKAMSTADVVISSHGTHLLQVLWMRENSNLIEAHPWHTASAAFSLLARGAGVNYRTTTGVMYKELEKHQGVSFADCALSEACTLQMKQQQVKVDKEWFESTLQDLAQGIH